MKFREMMELYKEGKLEDSKKLVVEAEIEKHEVISDYIYENEQIPSVKEILGSPDGEDAPAENESIADKKAAMEKRSAQEAQDFAKRIRSEIKKMMIKTAAAVLAIVLIAVILITVVMPKVADNFCYKPDKEDFQVYTSLFLPDKHFDDNSPYIFDYNVTSYGWGNYDVEFSNWEPNQTDADGAFGKGTKFTISIEKGRIKNDPIGFFRERAYYPFFESNLMIFQYSRAVLAPEMEKKFSTIADKERYAAYISFEKPMKLDKVTKWLYNNNLAQCFSGVWIAACATNDKNSSYYSPLLIGMDYSNNPYSTAEDTEYYEKEFVSNIKKYAGNERFINMMEINNGIEYSENIKILQNNLNDFADMVEENGMYVYAIHIASYSGEALKKLYDKNEEIEYMCFEQ